MKKIGIILRDYKSLSNNDLLAFRSDLYTFLEQYKIIVTGILINYENPNQFEEFERVVGQIKECDGVIIPGGQNAHEIDLKIAKYLYEIDKPTLGLCLGMQIMALAMNGDIEILKTNFHQSNEEYVHEVKINTHSLLYKILKKKKILVNSRHNEHITSTDLHINAISDDLIIEGVESQNKKFFIGVQWHPESLINDINSKRLFDYFIKNL